VQLFYERLVEIVLGVLFVLLCDMISPWYTSVAALEKLGAAFNDASGLLTQYYDAFYVETKLAACDSKASEESGEGLEVLDGAMLIAKVAQPLSKSHPRPYSLVAA
jgi:hypothetical protein